MKYFKYSQYLYSIVGIVFLISTAVKFFKGQDYGLQLIIGVGLLFMSIIRHFLLKRIGQNQKK